MEGDAVGAAFDEGLDIIKGADDHQMHIKKEIGHLPDGLKYGRAEREVRDEDAVHHIQVDGIGRRNARKLPVQP